MNEVSQLSPRHKLNPHVCYYNWRLAFYLYVHEQHTTNYYKKLCDYSGEAKEPGFLCVFLL